jgi:hypothetical protein
MDRAMLMRHLAQAEQHIADGERHLTRQRATICELEQDGFDAVAARALLASFKQTQALHVAHRERVSAEISGEE